MAQDHKGLDPSLGGDNEIEGHAFDQVMEDRDDVEAIRVWRGACLAKGRKEEAARGGASRVEGCWYDKSLDPSLHFE